MRFRTKLIANIKRILYTTRAKHQVKQFGKNFSVHNFSTFTAKTEIGTNANFNGIKIVGNGSVRIGNNFHSGDEILIITQNHNYDSGKKIPYDSTYMLKNIIIEDNVWIGSRVTIAGNVHIGEGAIIQTGSTVISNIPPLGIAGGHPAKVFKYRDKEHYFNLKKKKEFL